MIAAHPSPIRAPPEAVKAFLAGLTGHIRTFSGNEIAANVAFIKERFGYKEDDIREWLTTVRFTHDTSEVQESTIVHTLRCVPSSVACPARPAQSRSYKACCDKQGLFLLRQVCVHPTTSMWLFVSYLRVKQAAPQAA